MRFMDNPIIKVLLNNNPVCDAIIESTVKKEVWNISNKPYILIQGENFKNGNAEILALYNEQELGHGKVTINNNSFTLKLKLKELLSNDIKKIDIIVDKQKFVIPVNLKKLFGTIKYFNGQPVKNPIIDCTHEEDITAIGDEKGNFEIVLSSKVDQIGVFEKNYSKSTLEAWLYNVDIKKDTKLDIKIDKAEVFGISMWKQYNSDYIHFIPMSLIRTRKAMEKGIEGELDLSCCDEIKTELSREDVQVFSNNKEIGVLSFCEVDDFIAYKDGKKVNRLGYIVSIPKEIDKHRIIKIVISSKFLVNGKEIVDKGEGYYFFK